MDNDERDGPSAERLRGEQLAIEQLAPLLADEDEPEVKLFAVGHLLGILLSSFPAEHREEAGKAVLFHAETMATRLDADLVRAAYIRRDEAQRELEGVLSQQRSEERLD